MNFSADNPNFRGSETEKRNQQFGSWQAARDWREFSHGTQSPKDREHVHGVSYCSHRLCNPVSRVFRAFRSHDVDDFEQ